MQCDKPRAKGWERLNQVCNAMKKGSKIKPKNGITSKQTIMHPHLAPHKISNAPDMN
jgi:hypothetical protein